MSWSSEPIGVNTCHCSDLRSPSIDEFKSIKLENNRIIIGLDSNFEKSEEIPSPPNSDVSEISIENNEIFALIKYHGKSELAHFLKTNGKWKIHDFDIMESLRRITSRNPISYRNERGYLIATHNNQSESRAKISQNMHFEDHSVPITTNNIYDGLDIIASLSNHPNSFFSVRLQKNLGSSELDNKWEKQQAIDFLRIQLNSGTNEKTRQEIENAINAIQANIENDRIIYIPSKSSDIIEEKSYWEIANSYSMRFLNFVPDKVELNKRQWDYITEPFVNDAKFPKAERDNLRESARRFELVIGSQTGTSMDIGGWTGNLFSFIPSLTPFLGAKSGQTNCNYEYETMRVFLKKIQIGNFLRYHELPSTFYENLATKYFMHQAVKFKEKENDKWFVLDAWPMGNGRLPNILPEDEWGIECVTPSFDILPTWESISNTPPESRAATGTIGLGLSGLYFNRQAKAGIPLTYFMMPGEQRVQIINSSTLSPIMNAHIKKITYQSRGMAVRPFYAEVVSNDISGVRHSILLTPTDDIKPAGHHHTYMAAHKKLSRFIPKRYKGNDFKSFTGNTYVQILQNEKPISNQWIFSAKNYLRTPKGIVNSAAIIFSSALIASSIFAGNESGVPENWDNDSNIHANNLNVSSPTILNANNIEQGSLLGLFLTNSFMAGRYGATSMIVEAPLVMPPFVLGHTVTTEAVNEIADAKNINSLKRGKPANEALGIAGGAGSIWAARKIIGQQLWNGATARINNFLVRTIGGAGLKAETLLYSTYESSSVYLKSTAIPSATAMIKTVATGGMMLDFIPLIMIIPPSQLDSILCESNPTSPECIEFNSTL